MDDCNCCQCNNDDAPEMHEICDCLECHDLGYHMDSLDWSDVCEVCEGIVEKMAEFYGGGK